MRVLVTGAGGQLGIDVVRVCTAAGDDVVAADRSLLDVTDRSAVLGSITTLRPDAVINCAAWTAVDACESDPDRAWLANGLAARWLREACELSGAHLVQVSTDYVFDGTKEAPYVEWDEPNPRSVYGRSKLAGEREVGPEAAVVRTAWVVGVHGANMIKTILRLAAERPALAFVGDQRGCPTFTADLAAMLRRLAVERRSGVHHVTNQGAMSWFEFAQRVVGAAGYDPAMVSPIATADLVPARPAPRPANSVLDNAVLRLSGLPLLRPVDEAIVETVGLLTR
jgi:dTDP-4-dehydrorhamnose reductase